ncbi:MAG: hypothetical protein U9N47_07915 [Thermodesulfobacteriota bacterium]|nr:hypothetical protein [Thermodesulfobacteriota bacterium]
MNHVTSWCIEKEKIFLHNEDLNNFISLLAAVVEQCAMDIYVWALMPHIFICCVEQRTGLDMSKRKWSYPEGLKKIPSFRK